MEQTKFTEWWKSLPLDDPQCPFHVDDFIPCRLAYIAGLEAGRSAQREVDARLCDDQRHIILQRESLTLPRGEPMLLRIAEGCGICAHTIRTGAS